MDRFDEELRARLRRAAQRPGALPEWGAIQARASVLRQRRNALRTAPVAASLLIAGVAFALSVNRAPAGVDVGSPGSVTTLTTVVESVPTSSSLPVTSTSVPQTATETTRTETTAAVSTGAESDDSIPADDDSDVSTVSAPTGSTPRSSIPRSTGPSTSSPSSTPPSTRSASCFGGTISVRISPSFGLISVQLAPKFVEEEREQKADEVKVRFGDGQRDCTVRVRSDGQVDSGGD